MFYHCATGSQVGDFDKFYFTFTFEVRMWVWIYQVFERDWILHHQNPKLRIFYLSASLSYYESKISKFWKSLKFCRKISKTAKAIVQNYIIEPNWTKSCQFLPPSDRNCQLINSNWSVLLYFIEYSVHMSKVRTWISQRFLAKKYIFKNNITRINPCKFIHHKSHQIVPFLSYLPCIVSAQGMFQHHF
jgi:hypothetical protein